VRILRREHEWRHLRRALRGAANEDVRDLTGDFIEAHDAAVPTAGIDDVWIRGVGSDVTKLEAANREPVAIGDYAIVAAAWDGGGAAILLRGVGNVGKLVVGDDVIELASGLVEPIAPGFAAVEADSGALIDAENHALRILRIDPENVIVIASGSAFECREGFTAVERAIRGGLHRVDRVRIARIDVNAADVTVAGDACVGCDFAPSASRVVGAIEAAS